MGLKKTLKTTAMILLYLYIILCVCVCVMSFLQEWGDVDIPYIGDYLPELDDFIPDVDASLF